MASDPSQTTRDEPLSPKCSACREPRGTCFPGPCKAYVAKMEADRAKQP
jgi:hypothetical protein